MSFFKAKRHALAAVVICSLGAGGLLLGRGRGAAVVRPSGEVRAAASALSGSPTGVSPSRGEQESERAAPGREKGPSPGAGLEGKGVVAAEHRGGERAGRVTGDVLPAVFVEDREAQALANARSVVEAVQTGQFPERLSPLVSARPFDKAAFERDPRAYLDVVEPGRVFQTADGAEGVKTLEAVGVPYLEVAQEGNVRLAVVGEPLAPVTFTSFDMGAFENKLASMTVRADAAGAASVRFTATKGTIASVHISAGSPMAVGQVQFLVEVARD